MRWTDAHVPFVDGTPAAYDEVAEDLDRRVTAAGLEVEATDAPRRCRSRLAGSRRSPAEAAGSLVPERLIQLKGQDLDILIYPMDLLISGKPELVARARAAMASKLTTSAAHLTVSAEAQAHRGPARRTHARAGFEPDRSAASTRRPRPQFEGIDTELATLNIPYDEWEVLYRQRLQVERDLRAGAWPARPSWAPGLGPRRQARTASPTLRPGRRAGAGRRRGGRGRGDRRRDGQGARSRRRPGMALGGADRFARHQRRDGGHPRSGARPFAGHGRVASRSRSRPIRSGPRRKGDLRGGARFQDTRLAPGRGTSERRRTLVRDGPADDARRDGGRAGRASPSGWGPRHEPR